MKETRGKIQIEKPEGLEERITAIIMKTGIMVTGAPTAPINAACLSEVVPAA